MWDICISSFVLLSFLPSPHRPLPLSQITLFAQTPFKPANSKFDSWWRQIVFTCWLEMTSPGASSRLQIAIICMLSILKQWFLDNCQTDFENVDSFGKHDSSNFLFCKLFFNWICCLTLETGVEMGLPLSSNVAFHTAPPLGGFSCILCEVANFWRPWNLISKTMSRFHSNPGCKSAYQFK